MNIKKQVQCFKYSVESKSSVDLYLALEHVPYQWIARPFGSQGEVALVALRRMLKVEVRPVELLRSLVRPLGRVRLLEPLKALGVIGTIHHHRREGLLQPGLGLLRCGKVFVRAHRERVVSLHP